MPELIGIVEHPLVAVGGTRNQQQRVAGMHEVVP